MMKKKTSLLFYFLVTTIPPLFFSTMNSQDPTDMQIESLLKDLEKIMMPPPAEESQNTAPVAPSTSMAMQPSKISASPPPAPQKKDLKTNFLESFNGVPSPAPTAAKGAASAVTTVELPYFKKEALEAYVSNFLINLIKIKNKMAATDIYRRTKTFAPFSNQLNDVEMLLWEILNSEVYHLPFFAASAKKFRETLLSFGKQLEKSSNILSQPSSGIGAVKGRAAFEALQPEQSHQQLEFSNLEKLFKNKLGSFATDIKQIIKAAGKDIDEVKKKQAAGVKDSEKRLHDLQGRASRYRSSDSPTQSSSFWDMPYKPGTGGGGLFDNNFGIPDFWGDSFSDLMGNPSKEDEMAPQGKGGAQGGEAGGKEAPGGVGTEGPQNKNGLRTFPSNPSTDLEEALKNQTFLNNANREDDLKREIIMLIEDAEKAVASGKMADARELVSVLNSAQGPRRALALLEPSLADDRKTSKEWQDRNALYQAALSKLPALGKKAGISQQELDAVEASLKNQTGALRSVDQSYHQEEQQELLKLKPYKDNLCSIAKIILDKNAAVNHFKLSSLELQALKALADLTASSNDAQVQAALKNAAILCPTLKIFEDFFAARKKKSLKFSEILQALESLKKVQARYIENLGNATATPK